MTTVPLTEAERRTLDFVLDGKARIAAAAATPACFDSRAEFLAWLRAARYVSSGQNEAVPGRLSICVDCTRPYQAEMVAAGRCEHPEYPVKETI